MIFLLGNFSPPLFASQTVSLTYIASLTYDASFSYNIVPFLGKTVIPEKVSFNSSGTQATFTVVNLGADYVATWGAAFGVNPWNQLTVSPGPSAVGWESPFQMRQVLPPTDWATGAFLLSSIKLGASDLYLYSYASQSTVLSALATTTLIANNVDINVNSHAMVITRKRAHFFWLGSGADLSLHTITWNGSALSAPYTFPVAFKPIKNLGVSGCVIKDGTNEYIAVTYMENDGTSSPTIVILDDQDSSALPGSILAGSPILNNFDAPDPLTRTGILQDPRTYKIYLSYIKGPAGAPTGKVIETSFTLAGGFSGAVTSDISIPGNDLDTGASPEGVGLPNYENTIGFRRNAGLTVRDAILQNDTWKEYVGGDTGYSGFPSTFLCQINGRDCLGITVLNGFTDFYLMYRYLDYPKDFVWEKGAKVLHIEGPPASGTPVTVQAIFPEMATSASLVSVANAAGARVQIDGATGVIASQNTIFTLTFDKPVMRVASYNEWYTAPPEMIKLYDNTNTSVPITRVALEDTASRTSFKPNADLVPDSIYKIYIASDVIDGSGTQKWGNATFTFTTQKAQSGLLASEITGLSAYSDAGRTNLIAGGSEINATTTLYFRLSSIDPASNTIDIGTLSYLIDGAFLASFVLTQPITATTAFEAASITSITGDHVLSYKSLSPAGALSFPVNFPVITGVSPASGAAGVTINTPITLNFSEALATPTANKTNIRLSYGGTLSSYSLSFSGSQVKLFPDDIPGNGMIPAKTYLIEVGSGVTDVVSNPFSNTPATYSPTFSTQSSNSAPTAISAIALFKDAARTIPFGAFESISATAAVYVRVTGTDGATQTQDVTTATINLSWNGNFTIPLTETASDSGGFYDGKTVLGSIPVYDFPVPAPPGTTKYVTFLSEGAVPKTATVTVDFPLWKPASTTADASSGSVTASGASNILLDSTIRIGFNPAISSGTINSSMIDLLKGGVSVPVTYSVNNPGDLVTLTPVSALIPEATYVVSGPYATTGIRNAFGNPLSQPFLFSFSTQASQTPPVSIASLTLFPTASYTPLSALPADSDYNSAGVLFIEMTGVDGASQTQDSTIASLSDGRLVTLTETASNTGVYQGSIALGGLADGYRLLVSSKETPAASSSILIKFPSVSATAPASGAANVSILTDIRLLGNEDLDNTTVVAANVRFYQGAVQLAGVVGYNVGTRIITLTPSAALGFSTSYRVEVDGLKDLWGNQIQAQFTYTFSSQGAMTPPVTISALKIFSDNLYSSALASNAVVFPGQEIFFEVTAVDLSAVSQDSTPVKVTSNSGASFTLNLTETAVNSGIFRGSGFLFPTDNHTVTINSVEDPAFQQPLIIPAYPQVVAMNPASGSTDIPIDTFFTLTTSNPVDNATLDSASVRLADSNGILSPTLGNASTTQITVDGLLATNSTVFLEVKTSLKDNTGLPFKPILSTFQTLPASYGPVVFYSDAAFTTLLPNGSFAEPASILYVEVIANDLRTRTLESITGRYSDGVSTSAFPLTEDIGGRFRGSFVIPNSPGKTLTVQADVAPWQRGSLEIAGLLTVTSVSPASGAIWVPVDIWPTWAFARKVDPARVTAGRFTIRALPGGPVLPVTLVQSIDGLQVTLRPGAFMSLLTQYEISVASDVTDLLGKPLGTPFTTTFTSKGPPIPTAAVHSLLNYRDGTYVGTTSSVIPGGLMHIEVVADDTSSSTTDFTWARIDSSDSLMTSVDLLLTETGPNSGIFRGSLAVAANEGSTIAIVSRADPAFSLNLTVQGRPTVTGVNPASGTVNAYLDQTIYVTFSRSIDPASLPGTATIKSSTGVVIPVSTLLTADGSTIGISPTVSLATGTKYFLTVGSPLAGSDGILVASSVINFTTKTESVKSFDLLSGLAPRANQSASLLGEVIPGNISVIASTADLFSATPEYRFASITIGGSTFNTTLSEMANSPGGFIGTILVPDTRGISGLATLQFGNRPKVSFKIAQKPSLMGFYPASGAADVAEDIAITASFSRPMAPEIASGGLKLGIVNSIYKSVSYVTTGTAPTTLEWLPKGGLNVGMTYFARPGSLVDLLGQPVDFPEFTFSVTGSAGIHVYEDFDFTKLVTGDIIRTPEVYIELAVLTPPTNPADRALLRAVRQRTATSPLLLPLRQFKLGSKRYRGDFLLEAQRGLPRFVVPLIPGERLELTSPNMPTAKKVYYYMVKGSTSPKVIRGISLFREKFFAQKVEGEINQANIFIEVEADDLNWLSVDTTKVTVVSDSDPRGFELTLVESGPHTGKFRGLVSLDPTSTMPKANRLKARPGERITLTSVTDKRFAASIRWIPVLRLEHLVAWPSPVRKGGTVTFSFYLTYPADVDLFVYDTAGEEIHYAFCRGKEGENRISWGIPGRMANGVYFYKLNIISESEFKIEKRKFNGKFAVLR